jgi:hypothetical protein
MEPRNLKSARPLARDGSDWAAAREGRATVVIADSGTSAEVLVFPAGEPVGRGAEFHYGGTRWIIACARRDSGILVAEPVAH